MEIGLHTGGIAVLVSCRDGTARSIAMSIAKIERRGVAARRAVPNYWL